MTDAEIFLVDSNILVYNYDKADREKHKTAKQLLDTCWKDGTKMAVSVQNLSELFSVTTSKKMISKKEAITDMEDIINFPGWIKINFDHKTVLEAAKISEEVRELKARCECSQEDCRKSPLSWKGELWRRQ